MIKKLRGQPVDIDTKYKTLTVKIFHPLGLVYSLSDKIVNYLSKGYTIVVNLPELTQEIKSISESFRKEEVKSKFENCPSWYRYWFRVYEIKKPVENKQLRFV